MRTSAAVTGADGIPVGYGLLVAVYAALFCGAVWMLRRVARTPIEGDTGPEPALDGGGGAAAGAPPGG
jgi:hypothetical protein